MTDIHLSRLSHDVVQDTYKELHALLDSLGDAEAEDRSPLLLDFLLKARHRFARLLVAVRWFMSYSAFHSSAQVTKQLASMRSNIFTNDADSLWTVSGITTGAAAPPSAVQEAAEIMGAAEFFDRMPRVIENALGIDVRGDMKRATQAVDLATKTDPKLSIEDPKPAPTQGSVASKTEEPINSLEADDITPEAIERLRIATKQVISSSLPDGVVIMKLGVRPGNAAVQIGIPDAWTADVILDQLKVKDASILLLRFSILVDSHPDAKSKIHSKSRSHERAVPLRKEAKEPLRQMLEDRMRWATLDAASSNPNRDFESALLCLSRAMSFECCGSLAMEHVRLQASALLSEIAWSKTKISLSGVGSEGDGNPPIIIEYWKNSHMRASIVISLPTEENYAHWKGDILNVAHHEKLLACTQPPRLCVKSINVESLLLDTCRIRATYQLRQLQQFCDSKLQTGLTTKIIHSGCSVVSLVVFFDNQGAGLKFGFSLKTGGFFVHCVGVVNLAICRGGLYASSLENALWNGDRFFSRGANVIGETIMSIISKTLELLRMHVAMRSVCAADMGAITTWPPGPASVEKPKMTEGDIEMIKPPLVPIDLKRPRHFLSLVSVANKADAYIASTGSHVSKRARKLPYHYTTSSNGYCYFEGRQPEGEKEPAWCNSLHNSSHGMANWVETRYLMDARLRQAMLLIEFSDIKLGTPLHGDYMRRSPYRMPIVMKTSPIETQSAYLHLRGPTGWQVQLTLANDMFDENNFRGLHVSYSPSTCVLSFSYPVVSSSAVRLFSKDLIRVRTCAALLNGLSTKSKIYKVVGRNPRHVCIEACGLKLVVGLGKHAVQIESYPAMPLLSSQLIPHIEEILNDTGKDMGRWCGDLVDRAVPLGMAIQSAFPQDPSLFRVRFMTALRARLLIGTRVKQQAYAIDIDARSNNGYVMLIDVARAHAVTSAAKGQDASSTQFKPIPFWDGALSKVVSKGVGKRMHEGAAVAVQITIMKGLLRAIVNALQ